MTHSLELEKAAEKSKV